MTDKVHERLIKLFSISSSTGKLICDQVCVNLKLANMHGQYNSFNTWLQEEAGTQLNTRCYAYVLKLVMVDKTEKNYYSITLFGLLNSCAVFFSRILHTYGYFKRFTLRISYKNNICNSSN